MLRRARKLGVTHAVINWGLVGGCEFAAPLVAEFAEQHLTLVHTIRDERRRIHLQLFELAPRET